MASKQSGISLALSKHKTVKTEVVQNVFGDDEEEEKPQTSAEKFHSKYGNLKARDERIVKKVMDENPDIYDYDGVYDSIQLKRAKVEKEVESSRVGEKKSRYTESLMNAKKKRDLEKLLRDERKQEKERVAEGDEFKGKDVFVTSSYKKQLEETVQFRKELETSDRVDDLTAVSGQKMWRENFGKKLLEDRMRGRFGVDDEEEKPQTSAERAVKMELDENPEMHDSIQLKRAKVEKEVESSRVVEKKPRYSDDIADAKTKREPSRDERKHGQRSGQQHEKERFGDFAKKEKRQQHQRMNAIRKILARRNGKQEIEEAKQRYFERRNNGLVVPPV